MASDASDATRQIKIRRAGWRQHKRIKTANVRKNAVETDASNNKIAARSIHASITRSDITNPFTDRQYDHGGRCLDCRL
jgi:hypothetical protein